LWSPTNPQGIHPGTAARPPVS